MAHKETPIVHEHSSSAVMLVAVIGFSLYIAWVLLSCFWIVQPSESVTLDATEHASAFIGFPLGYLLLSVIGKNPRFNIFDFAPLFSITACAMLMPAITLLLNVFGLLPPFITTVLFLVLGMSGAALLICWLDIFSRFRMDSIGLALGISTLCGVVVFLLASSMDILIQSIAAIISICVSALLIRYCTMLAPGNTERAPLESVGTHWEYSREVAPSLVIFGFIFSLSFFFLPMGGEPWRMLVGLSGLGLGGIAAIIVSLTAKTTNITTVQRVITVICIVACIAMPFVDPNLRFYITIAMTGACSFLVIASSTFLVSKIKRSKEAPVFRAMPKRLIPFSAGFAAGWVIATIILSVGFIPDVIGDLRLVAAVALVVVIMFFMPVEKHHTSHVTVAADRPGASSAATEEGAVSNDGMEAPVCAVVEGSGEGAAEAVDDTEAASGVSLRAEEKAFEAAVDAADSACATEGAGASTASPATAEIQAQDADAPALAAAGAQVQHAVMSANIVMTESEAFEKRCATIVKLYQLSPREADILPYLAKGRNNAYLQEKFFISQHTAKSHIYNIYRKLDIHTQQKLMDFVEEFPLDYDL